MTDYLPLLIKSNIRMPYSNTAAPAEGSIDLYGSFGGCGPLGRDQVCKYIVRVIKGRLKYEDRVYECMHEYSHWISMLNKIC